LFWFFRYFSVDNLFLFVFEFGVFCKKKPLSGFGKKKIKKREEGVLTEREGGDSMGT
jgi:hypothetical protein